MSFTPRLLRTLATGAAAALLLAGCASPSPTPTDASPTASAATTRTVTTDEGTVTIPSDAERIVVLNTNLAGYLYALDIPVHAVATERPGIDVEQAEFPEFWAAEATADGSSLLGWTEDGFSLEAIAALKPDLIIGGGQGFAASRALTTLDQLNTIAPTVMVSATKLSWQDQLDYLASEVFDVPDRATTLTDAYDARVAEVSAAITLPELPVGFLMPTAGDATFSLPEDSQLPQTLAAVGLTPMPIIADNPGFETFGTGDSLELPAERVLDVLTAPTLFAIGFVDGRVSAAELAQNPLYAQLPAFVSGNVHDLPNWAYRADYQRTMTLLDEIEKMFS